MECECAVDTAGVPYHNCVRQSCLSLDQHPDKDDYELRPVNTSGQCCPGLERHACIDDQEVIPVRTGMAWAVWKGNKNDFGLQQVPPFSWWTIYSNYTLFGSITASHH